MEPIELSFEEKRDILIRRGQQSLRETYSQNLSLKVLEATKADNHAIATVNALIERERITLELIEKELLILESGHVSEE